MRAPEVWIPAHEARGMLVGLLCGMALAAARGEDARLLRLEPVAAPVAALDADLAGDWVFLSELPWTQASAGWSANGDLLPRRDRDAEKGPLRIGAAFAARGLGTHAPSRIAYDLAGAYTRFRARAAGGEAGGTVQFEVRCDGKSRFLGPVQAGLEAPVEIDIDIEGVRLLELLVHDGGDGINADMANWGWARVLGPASTPPPTASGDSPAAPPAPAAPCRVAVPLSAAPHVPPIVRWDWHFRETLPAIDTWEAIVPQLLPEAGEEEWTATLPVPRSEDGEFYSTWLNPIPARLTGTQRPPAEVRVAMDARGDGCRVRRVPSGSAATATAEGWEPAPVGKPIVGFEHAGGGGHDMWYHGFTRQFDHLLRFRPVPAPFFIRAETPFELEAGPGQVAFELGNPTDAALEILLRADRYARDGLRESGETLLRLAGGARERVAVPVLLDREGGGLVVLALECAGKRYRLPVFTHVETTSAVLASLEQIVADRPDAAAAAELERLRAEHASLLGAIVEATAPVAAWRRVFEAACDLRDRLLRRRLDFDELLFVKRKPFISEQPYMDAHHLFNLPGGGIYRLSPVAPDGEVRAVIDRLGDGIYRDVCLDWDARRILFAFGQGSDDWKPDAPSYHIYEIGIDGTGLRQLTFGPKNDCEPFYLPGGRIGFTSDRPEHYVLCGGPRHASILHSLDPETGAITQLSFNIVNEFNPSVLPDGRVIYTRWEYNERSVTSLHSLFTMRPDGTQVAPYYGNQTIRPNVLMFPRAVPGSSKVMALLTGHHGQTHGPAALIDIRVDVNGMDAVEVLNPGMPVIGEKIEDSRVGWASRPWPLSEETYLLSYTPTVVPWREASWALYVGDRHGNLGLVWRDPEISATEPIPLLPQPRPPVVGTVRPGADRADFGAQATMLLVDARAGQPGVEAGAVRRLRIIEDVPRKSVHRGGVIPVSATSMYTVKRFIGEVPVEPDGSAYFQVPANRSVYFALVDEAGLEIQRMRSVVCLRPEETRSCVGCHEPQVTAPPHAPRPLPAAALRPPDAPVPPPWGWRIFSYRRDVQPVLDRHCMPCHERDRAKNRVLLTGELTDQFSVSYEELLPYIKTAYATRWDIPYDVYPVPPRDFGSGASPLMTLLRDGHEDVQLEADAWTTLAHWIDANGVYYSWYEEEWPDCHIFVEPYRAPIEDVFRRRCAACHSDDKARERIRFPALDPVAPERSRALLAPLAADAGGWGACGGPVFSGRDDPDYVMLARGLDALARALAARPRRDLADLHEPDPSETALQAVIRR